MRPKYDRYQDYVISSDGEFRGEFEKMYQDFSDPWEQTTREQDRSEKLIAIHLLNKLRAKRVIELGSGLGHFTEAIRRSGFDVLGVDISSTAIEKARVLHRSCEFRVGDILNFDL